MFFRVKGISPTLAKGTASIKNEKERQNESTFLHLLLLISEMKIIERANSSLYSVHTNRAFEWYEITDSKLGYEV